MLLLVFRSEMLSPWNSQHEDIPGGLFFTRFVKISFIARLARWGHLLSGCINGALKEFLDAKL